ncbi:septum site-determining protein MinC [Lentibacillus sediminis]|uniref:septum site-determining protein MinC n=1 Tax=Lentibacillus sediminis TaxID=1940529 RepID=UPI000C1C08C7|nr:septum site-determining protein MinC [Lentibacillus sediminis]
MQEKRQLITIKGTRDGFSLFIDDSCTFDTALKELKEKIAAARPNKEDPMVAVTVKTGDRYLDEVQKTQLKEIISEENRFTIQAIESDVIRKADALQWKEESEIKAVNRTIRSGQVLEVTGDLLLIGDINPGGKVVSTGNIYIMGNLYGIAHAGSGMDQNAFIAASFMKPSQLRIADYISRAPDYESSGVYMECALIDKNEDKIIIDRLKRLSHKRDHLSSFERRMKNG